MDDKAYFNKNFKTIFTINIIIILILLLLIRIIHGPFNIKTSHNNLEYNISINNINIDKYTVIENYNKVIIPYFIYYNDTTTNKYNSYTNTYFPKEEKYILNLKLYTCTKKKEKTSCLEESTDKHDLKYKKTNYKLYIKYSEKEESVYEGNFKEDITEYLTKTGDYHITIEGTTNNINSKIEFVINIFN